MSAFWANPLPHEDVLYEWSLGPRLRQPDQRFQLPHCDRRAVRSVEPVVVMLCWGLTINDVRIIFGILHPIHHVRNLMLVREIGQFRPAYSKMFPFSTLAFVQ